MTRANTAIRAIAQGVRALLTEHSLALTAATKAALPRKQLTELREMYTSSRAVALQGQLLRLSDRREVAIYLRNDALWVADFIDGDGEIIDAVTWFRFNCGAPASLFARRRTTLESAIPLSAQLAARIESLHSSRPVRSDVQAIS